MKRTTVARGIYRDAYGYEIYWRDRGRSRTKRFPLDTPLDRLKAWRQKKVLQAEGKRDALGSFVRDAVRFLAGRKHLVSFKSDRAHLRPWIHRFRARSSYDVTREQVQQAIDGWRTDGYSPRELRHRRRILHQFFATLDPDASNPCTGVKLPPIVRRKPRPVDASLIREVALSLLKGEITGQLRDAKTRARFLLRVVSGMRPVQLMIDEPPAVDWDRGLWYVEPAKGDEGTIIALNVQIRAALLLFIAAQAHGRYDTRSFAKTLRRHGWPKGVRPYQLRHTVGQTLRELGTDLGDIGDHLGHSSLVTTRQHYVGPSLTQLRATSEKLDGRLDPFALTAPLPKNSPKRAQKQKAKEHANRPQSAEAADTKKAGSVGRQSTKPA